MVYTWISLCNVRIWCGAVRVCYDGANARKVDEERCLPSTKARQGTSGAYTSGRRAFTFDAGTPPKVPTEKPSRSPPVARFCALLHVYGEFRCHDPFDGLYQNNPISVFLTLDLESCWNRSSMWRCLRICRANLYWINNNNCCII